jgi:Tol biopolymer transport system component
MVFTGARIEVDPAQVKRDLPGGTFQDNFVLASQAYGLYKDGSMPRRASIGVVCCLVLATLALPVDAVSVQLLSARSSGLDLPAGGDGDSVSPSLTPDGRFVVFASSANDLTPGGNNFYSLNVFLRDRASNTTVLVSENLSGAGGGNGGSMLGRVSTNGQFVVFQSDAGDLVPNDTNGVTDIFIRDLAAGTTALVSVSTNGGPANGASTDPVMTPDGRYVAFISRASNLVPDDTNGIPDIFVRDLTMGKNYLVSVSALASGSTNPVMATPVITPDGRYVAFFSSARNLASGVPGTSQGEIYVRDLVAGSTTWASTNAAAMVSAVLGLNNTPSYRPQLSDDGRYVVFKTGQSGPDGVTMILRYDTLTATTTAVDTNTVGGYIGYDDAGGPVTTPDARFVAYARHEGAANSGYSSVHVWDGQTALDILVSDDGSGVPTNTTSQMPLISTNGRFVAFLSDATNLVTNVVASGFHVYRRDLQSGTTQLVDVDTNGTGSIDETMTSLSLSADGQFVAFSSLDGGLMAGDNNEADDVFVRDTLAAATELISQRDATVPLQAVDGLSALSPSSVSADGQWVVFSSPADDLVPNDTNRLQDVFVRHLGTNGANVLVSRSSNGGPAWGGNSGSAVISTNGVYVAFVSSASNLVAGVASSDNNVYLRNLNGPTLLVSVATNGASGNGDSSDPVISPDGRYVAFLSQANNLAPGITGGTNTYWRDVSLGQTVGLPGAGAFRPSLGGDGRYVAYSATNGLRVRDMQSGTDIYTHLGTILTAAIDPTGTKIFYETTNLTFYTTANVPSGAYRLGVDDVAGGSNLFSITTRTPLANGAGWSDDGRWLAFLSTTNLGSGDDGINRVYLRDFQTGTLSLIGLAGLATNAPELLSDAPVVSGDGRFVAYRSTVINTAIGDASTPPNEFLLDRLTGATTALTTGTTVPGPVMWLSRPVLSDGGATVAFLNAGSGLATGVLNRTVDAFGASVDVNAALIDSDGDGIPDWWMLKYFGHPTGESNDLSLASDDADGDGMSNLQEYLAGTSPIDPNSVFKFSAAFPASGLLDLTWPAVLGRSYQIQYKTNLTDPVWLTAPGGVWVLDNQGYYIVPVVQPHSFYRLFESN